MTPEQHLYQQQRAAGREPSRTTRLGIVGLSDHGLASAQLASRRGYEVIGFDDDEVRAAQLLAESRDALQISSERSELSGLDAYLICTPAPIVQGAIDYGYLKDACHVLGERLVSGTLVVIETPVEPGVCERIALPILEKSSGLSRHQFHFAHAPIREPSHDGSWTIGNTPRVLGALTREARERAHELYDGLIEALVHPMQSIREAEAVTLLESAFLDVNNALVNELAIAFHDAGIDITHVVEGAATKPYDFLPRAPGFAEARGTADPYRALRRERRDGYEHRFLAAAHKTNRAMPAYLVRMLTDAMRERRIRMAGTAIALLGIGEHDDADASREIAALLAKKNMRVRTFDPLSPALSSVRTLDEAFQNAKAALILERRDQFCTLSPEYLRKHGVVMVIDGLNCLDKSAYDASPILHRGIGR